MSWPLVSPFKCVAIRKMWGGTMRNLSNGSFYSSTDKLTLILKFIPLLSLLSIKTTGAGTEILNDGEDLEQHFPPFFLSRTLFSGFSIRGSQISHKFRSTR